MAAYLMKTSLALLLCASLGDGIPLSSFYSYGSAAGDSTLGAIDDGSSPAIASSTAFVFYGNSYSTIYVRTLPIAHACICLQWILLRVMLYGFVLVYLSFCVAFVTNGL